MKNYLVCGTELCFVKMYVSSDKSPEDFNSLEEFIKNADDVTYKTMHGDIQSYDEWEEIEWVGRKP